ncbi:hypothetical protein [Enterococcus mundtii]|uniref:Uncharacterized protein n=1 Tax=Enterococcus mundtii TaxID=53346 RepID=A0A242KUZ9_ENTMU|nr:hypothetical protein [Enterococcus mundtii]OTP24868.1 hypothetical protein A5802_003023 [Enterococcus mundtii]
MNGNQNDGEIDLLEKSIKKMPMFAQKTLFTAVSFIRRIFSASKKQENNQTKDTTIQEMKVTGNEKQTLSELNKNKVKSSLSDKNLQIKLDSKDKKQSVTLQKVSGVQANKNELPAFAHLKNRASNIAMKKNSRITRSIKNKVQEQNNLTL